MTKERRGTHHVPKAAVASTKLLTQVYRPSGERVLAEEKGHGRTVFGTPGLVTHAFLSDSSVLGLRETHRE